MNVASRFATIAGTCASAALLLGGCAGTERVTLNSLPIEVRAPLDRETYGGEIVEIERRTQDDLGVVYASSAKMDGQMWAVVIDDEGNLISKEQIQGEFTPSTAKMTSNPDAPAYKWW